MSTSIVVSTVDMNYSMLISFVVFFHSLTFEPRLNSPEFPVKSVLEWIETAKVPMAKEIMESMKSELRAQNIMSECLGS